MKKKLLIFLARIGGIVGAVFWCYYIGGEIHAEQYPNASFLLVSLFKTIIGFISSFFALVVFSLIVVGLSELWPKDSEEEIKEKEQAALEKAKLSDPNFDPLKVVKEIPVEIKNERQELNVNGKIYKINA